MFFTGGIDTAKKIYSQQYFRFIPTVFELGGKSPMIIDDTIDLKFAATKYLTTKLINSGQICVAADYLIIKKNVVQEFVKNLKEVYETNFKTKTFYNGNLISKTKVDQVNS
ncbi:aldehyde dehydrogenase [bacterium]|nr:aldehyde dehydrogenase [bacterium]